MKKRIMCLLTSILLLAALCIPALAFYTKDEYPYPIKDNIRPTYESIMTDYLGAMGASEEYIPNYEFEVLATSKAGTDGKIYTYYTVFEKGTVLSYPLPSSVSSLGQFSYWEDSEGGSCSGLFNCAAHPSYYPSFESTGHTIHAYTGAWSDGLSHNDGTFDETGDSNQNEEWDAHNNSLFMRIVEPKTGTSFAGTNKVHLLVNYKYPANYTNLKLSFKGFLDDTYQITSDKVYSTVETVVDSVEDERVTSVTYMRRSIVVEGYVAQDEPVTLTAGALEKCWWLPAALEPYIECSTTITAYSDFIDANGDGLDDRTGTANGDNSLSGGELFPGSGEEGNDTPMTGDSLSTSVDTSNLANIFKNLGGFTSNFVAFITDFFSFIPVQIITLLVFGFSIIIALRIFGR